MSANVPLGICDQLRATNCGSSDDRLGNRNSSTVSIRGDERSYEFQGRPHARGK